VSFSKEDRRKIYNRTSGYCHICGKKLSFENYGYLGLKGAWEVEHSNPKSMGGTNRLNNLYPACITCNRSKNNNSTRSARAKHGRIVAPLSKENRKIARKGNAITGGLAGGFIGLLFGPIGIIVGAALGTKFGYDKNPDKN